MDTMNDLLICAKDYLRYDPDTGKIYWTAKTSRNRSIRVGDEAGTVAFCSGKKYRHIQFDRQRHYSHRIAWLLYYGEAPNGLIDHINGNGLDNRITNLRVVDAKGNARNNAVRKQNKSGVTGVAKHRITGNWQSKITADGVRHWLYCGNDFFEACCARRSAENLHGFTIRKAVVAMEDTHECNT